jgi:hypothetical protein
MNYDEDENFGFSVDGEEDLDGFSITGEDDGFDILAEEGDAMGDAWLTGSAEGQTNKLDADTVDGIVSGDGLEQPDHLVGAAKISDLQLGRIDGVSYGVQAGIKAILEKRDVAGIDPLDAAAARQVFGELIGMDTAKFASQIKVDETVELPNSYQDHRKILSMLQNTSGEYLDRGPGAALVNKFNDEKQEKENEELLEAFDIVKEIADHYIHPNTIGTDVEKGRRRSLEDAITLRLRDGVFFDNSRDILPLPNETGVAGIKITQGIWPSRLGTSEDRVSAAGKFDHLYKSTKVDGIRTKFERDENHYKVFVDGVTEEERRRVLTRTPSVRSSIFPNPTKSEIEKNAWTEETVEKKKAENKKAYEELITKANKARATFIKQFPTIHDENYKQNRTAGKQSPTDHFDKIRNLMDEAAILGKDWDGGTDYDTVGSATGIIYGTSILPEISLKEAARRTSQTEMEKVNGVEIGYSFDEEYISHEGGLWRPSEIRYQKAMNEAIAKHNDKVTAGEYVNQGTGKGSDRGGMYGYKKQSEISRHIEDALDEEEEQRMADIKEGRFSQGTQAWLDQRKGKITASTAATLLKPMGAEEMAVKLASERLGIASSDEPNAHMREGNDGEEKALTAFLMGEGKGLHMEEAFFETHMDYEGFGVSPDGRLYEEAFDPDNPEKVRKSAGLLELKFLSTNRMEGALDRYMPQMQMQMAIAGESQTHFYALDKHTGDNMHYVVKADPKMQKKLLKAGWKAKQLEQDLDPLGAQELRKKIKARREYDPRTEKQIAEDAAKEEAELRAKAGEDGQTKAFETADDDQPMTPFEEDVAEALDSEEDLLTSDSEFAVEYRKQMKRRKQSELSARVKEAIESSLTTADGEGGSSGDKKETVKAVSAPKENPANKELAEFYQTHKKLLEEEARLKEASRARKKSKVKDATAEAEMSEFYKTNKSVLGKRNQLESAAAIEATATSLSLPDLKGDVATALANEDLETSDSPIAVEYRKQMKSKDDEALKQAVSEAISPDHTSTDNLSKAQENATKATKEAERSVRNFTSAMGKAIGVLGELGGVVADGNKSAMDTIRMAAETGQTHQEVRGMERALKAGSLDQQGALNVINAASRKAMLFRDEKSTAAEIKSLHHKIGLSNLEEVHNLKLPDVWELQNLKPNELLNLYGTLIEGIEDPMARAQASEILLGTSEFAMFNKDADSLLDLNNSINKEGAIETEQGLNWVRHTWQDVKEDVGSLGFGVGVLAGGSGLAALAVKSQTGKAVASQLAKSKTAQKGAQATASKLNTAKDVTKVAGGKVTNAAGKALQTASKLNPVGLATAAVSIGGRTVGGVEDDGGLADSALDVLEFASSGSALGMGIGAGIGVWAGGIGAAPGAAIGATLGGIAGGVIGVGNELWEWATGDDDEVKASAIPSANIGAINQQSTPIAEKSKNIVNVEVTNEISPDLIKTTTGVNGDLTVDQESTNSTGTYY